MVAKAVAKRKSTEVAAVNYGEDASAGFENQTRADIAIPFINVLQALSPEIEKIDRAKAGMLYNTVTEELISPDAGLTFVPATTDHCYVEWVPRDEGGGYKGQHVPSSELVKEALAKGSFGEISTEYNEKGEPAGNDLVETFYVYGVLCDGDTPIGMAVLAFSSTKIKVYKKFNTRLRTYMHPTPDGGKANPPLFAHVERLSSFKDKNNKGEFYNFAISPANGTTANSLLATDDARYQAAKDCRDMVESGLARAAFETQGAEGGETEVPF